MRRGRVCCATPWAASKRCPRCWSDRRCCASRRSENLRIIGPGRRPLMSFNDLDGSLVFDAVRVTEAAAIAAWKLAGRGDEKAADQAAVDAMRTTLNALDIDGRIVIGEGERDGAER